MPETRFLPKKELRSTGLPRTTTAAPPPTTAGSNATSPVSAAPGVSRATHEHVLSARNPSAVVQGRPIQPTPQQAPRRPQDAKVQIIDRRSPAPVASVGGPAFQTRVELLPNVTGRGGAFMDDAGAPTTMPAPLHAGSPFTLEEALLIASVIERYRDNAAAVNSVKEVATSQSILGKLSHMHSPANRAVGMAAGRVAPAAAAGHGIAREGELEPVAAHTTTVILDRRHPAHDLGDEPDAEAATPSPA